MQTSVVPAIPDSRVRALLSAQSGVVASAQLASLGISGSDLRRWLREGALVRLRRGAFVEGGVWHHSRQDERYRLTVMSVMRSRSTEDTASHHSALALHGLPLWHVDRALVVLAADVAETTTWNGLRLMRLRALVAPTRFLGLPLLDVADAVVTTASVSYEGGLVAADAATHSEACTTEDLHEAAERLLGGLRGRRRVRSMLADVDPLCESPGESRTRIILRALDVPVRSQAEIRDRLGDVVARVDFLVGERCVIEFDGAVKYGGAEGREALVREKLREDRLRELGYIVIRLTWDDLTRPQVLLARIRVALSMRD
ncbi:very-short-patch-repair endonuclease [Phycicoccus badiiscoriae]|uniref:Very-short-patch-repair endonuclease n=1 Tax=Pedococcus badiiscoriae TaxID=642776 RepID=A0A852WM00_9MICO|nr:very-short-patch-repair endonuclease [Pedococcus badiiscoriae]